MHRGVLRFFWSTKLCVCVLIAIVLLRKKSLVGLDLSSGVYCSLHILRVLVYVMHYELLWFLSIYVFFCFCVTFPFSLCMMPFIISDIHFFLGFFFRHDVRCAFLPCYNQHIYDPREFGACTRSVPSIGSVTSTHVVYATKQPVRNLLFETCATPKGRSTEKFRVTETTKFRRNCIQRP